VKQSTNKNHGISNELTIERNLSNGQKFEISILMRIQACIKRKRKKERKKGETRRTKEYITRAQQFHSFLFPFVAPVAIN
jgi:hypothetical protein